MDLSDVRVTALIEFGVMICQFAGALGLITSRLMPRTRLARGGRLVFVLSMVGLAIGGAICGSQDSDFGLFAGGTMTVLLIGMIAGSAPVHAIDRPSLAELVESSLAV